MPEETESMKDEPSVTLSHATIQGIVVGYVGEERTRPIAPAEVFLLIEVIGKDEQRELFFPAPERELGKLKKHKVKGVEELHEMHPNIYKHIHDSLNSFAPVSIDKENTLAVFTFKGIPAGWWSYIAAAYVEDKIYKHTDKMGDNGLGRNDPIKGDDLLKQEGLTLNNVIIPVPDVWHAKLKKPPEVKVHETDKGMDDPRHVHDLRAEEI